MQNPDSFVFDLVRKYIEDQETAAYINYHNSTVEHQEAVQIRGGEPRSPTHCNKNIVGQANCLCTECLNAEVQRAWLETVRWGRERQAWADTIVAWTRAWSEPQVPGNLLNSGAIPWGAPGYPPAPLPPADQGTK